MPHTYSFVRLFPRPRGPSRPHTYPLMPHLHGRILNSASLIVLHTSGKSGKNERQCSLFETSSILIRIYIGQKMSRQSPAQGYTLGENGS